MNATVDNPSMLAGLPTGRLAGTEHDPYRLEAERSTKSGLAAGPGPVTASPPTLTASSGIILKRSKSRYSGGVEPLPCMQSSRFRPFLACLWR